MMPMDNNMTNMKIDDMTRISRQQLAERLDDILYRVEKHRIYNN